MRILVVRYRFIGDTLLTVPFLRNLRKAYPDATIDMLVAPVSGELLEDCPYVDNLLYFDTTKKHRYENGQSEKKSFMYYVKMLKANNYDKAYILKRSLSSAILCAMAGIKSRIGFNTEGRGLLLTKRVSYNKSKHEVESFLDVLRADGIKVEDDFLELWLKQEDVLKAEEILENQDVTSKKIIVHATSGNVKKQWKPEYFAQIIEKLINELDATVYHLGAKSDRVVYENIRAMIKVPLKKEPINLCGELSLPLSAAVISKMDLVFGNDSGTFHVAGALDVPTVVIYGPMDYKKWRVWNAKTKAISTDIQCYPCNLRTKCKNNYACLEKITPEIAMNFIKEMIS